MLSPPDIIKLIKTQTGLTVKGIAEQLGITRGCLYQWKLIPGHHCLALERIAAGAVSKEEMRPDLYREHEKGDSENAVPLVGQALAGANPLICD